MDHSVKSTLFATLVVLTTAWTHTSFAGNSMNPKTETEIMALHNPSQCPDLTGTYKIDKMPQEVSIKFEPIKEGARYIQSGAPIIADGKKHVVSKISEEESALYYAYCVNGVLIMQNHIDIVVLSVITLSKTNAKGDLQSVAVDGVEKILLDLIKK